MLRPLAVTLLAVLALERLLVPQPSGPPYSPQAALDTFRIAAGFQIETFAAEPLVSSPVAMEVDEAGRTYVVEMPGYPLDVSGSGRVRLLQDGDGDGRPDRSTVFADGLRLPNGIMRWKKGVLVTDAPDVLYLEDVDGDGRADVKRVMLTGFARTNPQHMMNTPVYGLDNWIYLANEAPVRTIRYQNAFGDIGAEIEFPDRPKGARLPADGGGRNVRFRPDSYDAEMLSSRGQFGHTFDEWGHHFLSTNNRHIFQEVIAQRYLLRSPSLVVASVVQQLPDYRQPADVFPITRNPDFQLLTDVGVMTSASGLTYYAADLFPPAYRTAAFVAESAHNLVHVDTVREHGASFRATRMFDGAEFLASTDSWFRPVNFYLGPDGALYVIDYYREVIEHPEWLDDTMAQSPRLYAGRDRGRIYRITPSGTAPASWLGRMPLGTAGTADLVRALSHGNIWWRRHAQRLLVERNPRDAVAPLTALAAPAATTSPVGRVHALWTLEGMGKLDARTIEASLSDPDPGVRENAIQLAELHLRGNPSLGVRLLGMRGDPHPRVRYQLLLTLGSVDAPAAAGVRTELLFQEVEDEWVQLAALSAPGWDPAQLWQAAVDRLGSRHTPARASLVGRIAAAAGSGKPPRALAEILRAAASAAPSGDWWRAATFEGLANGVRSSGRPGSEFDAERVLLAGLALDGGMPAIRSAAVTLVEAMGIATETALPILAKAETVLADRGADPEVRIAAVRLMAAGNVRRYAPLLVDILGRAEPAPLQVAALRALAAVETPRTFIDLWDRWTPAVRTEAIRALVRDPGGIRLLLDAVASGKINATEIDRTLRIRMMMVDDEALRGRARTLFPESLAAGDARTRDTRAPVLVRYGPAATLAGNADRGREVFSRVCSACHQYRGANGSAFGPDLGELRNHLPPALLVAILDPNRAIADRYGLWDVELTDGTRTGGIIAEETADAVTLRVAGGAQTAVPRARIKAMRVLPFSAMPEGLEAQIDVQQMADLIAFIKGRT